MKTASLTVVLTTIICSFVFAQDGGISWRSTELAPGLQMLEGQGGFPGGNLSLLTGDDGIVLIDGGLTETSAMTVATIERITDGPVNFLINTHAHGDHTGSNSPMMRDGTTVVAHDNLRRALLNDEQFDKSGLPELTFSESVTFHLNGHNAFVFFIPSAHTSGDSAIHFPEVNVIHAGDVFFNKVFPFIDLDGGGSVDGFVLGQQKLLTMADDNTQIVPGHGPLANKADLQAAVDMLIDAKSKVKSLVDAGMSNEQVLENNPLSVYDSWSWDFITTETMTNTLYRSLTSN